MQKRYWLRGGLTLITLVVVAWIVLYWDLSQSFPGFLLGRGGLYAVPESTLSLIFNYVVMGTPVLIVAFGFGALIGWLYGKIKNRSIPTS